MFYFKVYNKNNPRVCKFVFPDKWKTDQIEKFMKAYSTHSVLRVETITNYI